MNPRSIIAETLLVVAAAIILLFLFMDPEVLVATFRQMRAE